MSDLETRIKHAILELVDLPPLKALAILFGGLAPDMDAATLRALQDADVRLYQMIQDGLADLTAEVRSRINAEEVLEIAIQTHQNLRRTAQQEKRFLMITVCVHGILRPDDDAAEKRLFVRAIADLDIVHVALLRRAGESSFYGSLVVKDIQRTLIAELIARGFMQRTEKRTDLRTPETFLKDLAKDRQQGDRWTKYSLTALGQRFVDYMRGTSGTRREPEEPQDYVLKEPDPLP